VEVIGLPDLRLGEVVAAWVCLKPGMSVSEEQLRDYCKGQIAHFKIPQWIRFVDQFPMTVTGKIQKFRMRDYEIEERGLQAAARVQT
ncbi:AMP-binding protein, partial [Klebsiella pneumoniae]|nr:AMP-binding protein [Klebsiella pneumoniae]